MQRNSLGAARDGGPVVLRPVTAMPCHSPVAMLCCYAVLLCYTLSFISSVKLQMTLNARFCDVNRQNKSNSRLLAAKVKICDNGSNS